MKHKTKFYTKLLFFVRQNVKKIRSQNEKLKWNSDNWKEETVENKSAPSTTTNILFRHKFFPLSSHSLQLKTKKTPKTKTLGYQFLRRQYCGYRESHWNSQTRHLDNFMSKNNSNAKMHFWSKIRRGILIRCSKTKTSSQSWHRRKPTVILTNWKRKSTVLKKQPC